MVVDEIAIRYAAGGFEGDERNRVERYFLRSRERQDKVKVMSELLHHSATTRGKKTAESETPVTITDAAGSNNGDSGFFAAVRRFWSAQPSMSRFAVTLATVVIVVGVFFLIRSGRPTTSNFATLTLTRSETERGPSEANEIASTKLTSGIDELRIQLLLPAQQTQPKSYRIESIPAAISRRATVVSQDAQSVVLSIPAADLRPDRYGIRLFAVYPDGTEERIPGTYTFRVE